MPTLKEILTERLQAVKGCIREKTIVFTVCPACGQPQIQGKLTRDDTIEKMPITQWQQLKDELTAAIMQSLKALSVKENPTSQTLMFSYKGGIQVVTKIGDEWRQYFDHPVKLMPKTLCKEECGWWMVTQHTEDLGGKESGTKSSVFRQRN